MLRHNFVAMYFSLLPGGVGAEVVRAWRTRAAAGGLVRAAMVVFVDRLTGLVGLLLIVGLEGLVASTSAVPGVATLTRVAAALALVLAVLALGVPWLPQIVPGLRSGLERLPHFLRPIADVQPLREPAKLLLAVALSVGTQGAAIATIMTLLLGVAPATDFDSALRVAPFVVLLTFVPLTPLGFGQRELVFLGLWGAAGVSAAAAIGSSILVLLVGILVCLVGGGVLLWERQKGLV